MNYLNHLKEAYKQILLISNRELYPEKMWNMLEKCLKEAIRIAELLNRGEKNV